MVSLLNSMKCLGKNEWQSFSNTSKTVEEEEIFSNSFMRLAFCSYQSQKRTAQEKTTS